MKMWIGRCEQEHKGTCGVAFATREFVPTRLLDLKAFECDGPTHYGDDIKLVCSGTFNSDNKHPSYLTLSHCWGPPEKRPITTTRATLEANKNRIPFTSLSRTFRDAVVITRNLGQRYLWIDSLCIVQDDEKDWAQEASQMAKVYSCSYCTLAALSSSDSSGGLSMTKPRRLSMYVVHGPNNSKYRLHIPKERYNSQDISWNGWYGEYDGSTDDSPLRYRAWALQERELSTRTIYFGSHQLLWECRYGQACTHIPWRWLDDERKEVPSSGVVTEPKPFSERLNIIRRNWTTIVEDYSRRSLTKQTDKLTALSGIAQSYQAWFPETTYMAGIWSLLLPECLLWVTSSKSSRRAPTYVAPTWSWASVISPIDYEMQNIGYRTNWCIAPTSYSVSLRPKHDDPYGALVSAALFPHNAILVQLDSEFCSRHDGAYYYSAMQNLESRENMVFLTKNGFAAGMAFLDVMEEEEVSSEKTELACLILSEAAYETRPYLRFMGLLLRRDSSDDESIYLYRRIGLAFEIPASLAEDVERCTVGLV